MNTIHLESNDPTATEIAKAAFPSYAGRKFKVTIVKPDHTFNLTSGWDGGSRDLYAFVRLTDMKGVQVSNYVGLVGNNFNRSGRDFQLAEGFALVEHSTFMGKDVGLTIYLTEENATKMIPAPVELTRDEKVVLAAVRSLKSSYGGVKNYRQTESGLSASVWATNVEILKGKGLLNKMGAITPAGKNAIGNLSVERAQRS